MEVQLIKIGNSKGFRISKTILERYNITDKMELILEKNQLVLRPISEPRKGWDLAFQEMHKNGDDQLLIEDVFEDDQFEEWK
jgi:antitoxin MazE